MKSKLTLAKTHQIGIGAILFSIAMMLQSHSPENPVTIYSLAPVLLAIAQYLHAYRAHTAPSPKLITPAQVELITTLLNEREVTHLEIAEVTGGRELSDLSRREATELITLLKSKPRKRRGQQ